MTRKPTPRKARKPSRCKACGLDTRRGDLIVYWPRDAAFGQPRTWIHAGCEGLL